MKACTCRLEGAVVELYNLQVKGRSPFWYTNGWYVFEYRDGCRCRLLLDAKGNEQEAREYAKAFNSEPSLAESATVAWRGAL